jgi:VWFA-related protein
MMKTGLACFAFLAILAVAQNAELPSAPSAVVAPKPQTPPPATEKTTQPAADLAPAPDDAPKPATQPPVEPPKIETPAAENSARPDVDIDLPVVKARADEVNVIFTVTDKRGRFIKDLTQQDVKVLDNRLPIEQLRSFNAQTNLPLRVGLLVDASNSVRDQFKFEQEAAIEFLNQIIRPREDKAFVLGFDSTTEIVQDMTNSVEKLSGGIRTIRPGGGTALYDAVYLASRDKLLKNKETIPHRRAIILLSDGYDTQSRVTREEAIEMAQRAEVVIYTISTNFAPNTDKGDKVLQRFAEATGGRDFHPFKIEDVADAFSDISEELRAQYAIAYKPAQLVADGAYRTIDIQVPQKKYKVRARKGYYAPKGQ